MQEFKETSLAAGAFSNLESIEQLSPQLSVYQANYIRHYRDLLLRAQNWDCHGRDHKFLIRGEDFNIAQSWLSQTVTDVPPPTKLHRDYIRASQGDHRFYDIFISYGREDSKAFATQLSQQLSQRGLQVWFDQDNIPLGVDFQQQIDDGIEKSHNFLFIISPHAVNSIYCAKEIELAVQLNKRIIPVLHVEEIDHSRWKQRHPNGSLDEWEAYQAAGKHSSFPKMHPTVSKINWIYARQTDDFQVALGGLLELLHRHEDYVRLHTELFKQSARVGSPSASGQVSIDGGRSPSRSSLADTAV